jgi:hypothetical protein
MHHAAKRSIGYIEGYFKGRGRLAEQVAGKLQVRLSQA